MAPSSTIALVVAAGRGSRFGEDLPKQYQDLAGMPVLTHAIRNLLECPGVDAVRTVIHPDDEPLYRRATQGLDLPPPVHGAATRQASVLAGLEALARESPGFVLVHDGARPLVTRTLVARVLGALEHADAVLPALPVSDSLRMVDGTAVTGEVPRDALVRAQTPQGFRFDAVLDAHRRHASEAGATDDVELVRKAGGKVVWVMGEEDNLKVTLPDDLPRAARFLGHPLRRQATGFGFDIHRTEVGRPLVLAAVSIPAPFGLSGHSDADVVLHALTDALLGTVGAGDIGVHFPPSDEQWRGAASSMFVRHALDLVAARRGRLDHVDISIMAERPKIGPHRPAMVASLQDLLGLTPDRIGLKAGTMEGMDAVGRGEAIAAQALATVSFPS